MSRASLGHGVDIDVPQLIRSRLLIQANSGGGKSYAIRRTCEQTFGAVQHIVIDPEGEFYTLREKFDYTLLGKGGDGPADLKSAALLARRLLELGVSAIVDISELGVRRPHFVKLFLESLVAAPRELWHPVLVIVDEAHQFCPEKGRGESESTAAVIDLMTVGRKRGFCGVLSTQRVSKLNKDAAAECANKLVGRCTLDVDRKRAGEELGFSSHDDILALRDLEPGEFFVYGPALSKTITKFRVGRVTTTHPEAGASAPPVTPPRAKVKKVLEQLANLPHEVEEEAKNAAVLAKEVARLSRELREAKEAQRVETKETKVPVIDKESLHALIKAVDKLDTWREKMDDMRDRMAQAQQTVVTEGDNLRVFARQQLAKLKIDAPKSAMLPPRLRADALAIAAQPPRIGAGPIGAQKHPSMRETASDASGELNPARQRILDTILLLNRLDVPMTRDTLAAWYGVHPNNKGFTNNLGALRSAGYLDELTLTGEGMAAARGMEIPTQAELHEKILAPLTAPQRRIMEVLIEHGALERSQLAEVLGVHENNKGLTNNIGKLRSRQLATKGWPIQAGDVMRLQSV